MGILSFGEGGKIRKAAVAGAFYPGSPAKLKATVAEYLAAAEKVRLDGEVFGVMAPHAGYVYSAGVAAPVYKILAERDFETVVIIGHDFGSHARGISAVFADYDAFETPLGKVEVDTELQAALRKRLKTSVVHNGVHAKEHTVEIHLPFIQTVKPQCRIVPVMFGEVTPAFCWDFAMALKDVAGDKKVLVFASTDMTHYPNVEDSRATDAETMELIKKCDLAALCRRHDGTGIDRPGVVTPLCATGGVGVAMIWASLNGGNSIKVLKQANSGDVPGGDKSRVVGYGSAVFYKSGDGKQLKVKLGASSAAQEAETGNAEFSVSAEIQKELLSLVRRRITAQAMHLPWKYDPPKELPDLLKKAAVFVTLTKNGRLRGCIGTTIARDPLWEIVEYMAHAAAFEDPRFSAVTADELDELHVEISVLSPMKLASSHNDIIPFKHGVMIRMNGRSGLFLPQVWEQLPEKSRFMSYLCQEKADLPAEAWKSPDAKLYLFTVFAFEE